jgi:hypothetical protein
MSYQKGSRLKANRASYVFANPATHNGNGEGPPKNGSGPRKRPSSNASSTQRAYTSNGNGQAQSGNGDNSNGQHGTEQRYAKGEFFTGPKAALLNTDLDDLAFRILCLALARGSHWQIHPWQLERQFGRRGRDVVRRALRQLETAGYARLLAVSQGRGRISSGWQIRRSPDAAWPVGNYRRPEHQAAVNSGPKCIIISKKDHKGFSQGSGASGVSQSSGVKTNQRKHGVSKATNHSFSDVPDFPFPESEEEMYQTLDDYSDLLESYDAFADMNRDGDFFNDFSSRGWRYPSGRRVRNWMVAYIRRRWHVLEQMRLAWAGRNGEVA